MVDGNDSRLGQVFLNLLLNAAQAMPEGQTDRNEIRVSTRTGGELKLNAGTLYRSVQRMLEQGLIVEVRERPAPELDDERRRYYRLTPFGRAVARAETVRLTDLVRLARASGFAPRRV